MQFLHSLYKVLLDGIVGALSSPLFSYSIKIPFKQHPQQLVLVKLGGRMKIYAYLLSSTTKFDSKWIKDFNIRPDTLKILEKKVLNGLELIGAVKGPPEQDNHTAGIKINN